MSKLYNNCPTLFDAILPRTDHRDMTEDELDYELDTEAGNKAHHRATVIGQVSVKNVVHPINNNGDLPTKPVRMTDSFQAQLRRAYVESYEQPEIYVFQGRLQYANRFAFTDQ
jgi:hypothetical protein